MLRVVASGSMQDGKKVGVGEVIINTTSESGIDKMTMAMKACYMSAPRILEGW